MKNDAGVIVCVPLIPPQPTPTTSAKPATASRSVFQFIFTMAVCGGEIMGATIKSPFRLGVYTGLLIFLAAQSIGAQTDFAGEAETAFHVAKQGYSTNSKDFKAALDLSRTAFDRAEFSKNDDERESLAEIGISAGRVAVALDNNSAAAHYYLALNIGQLARTKMWGALKLIGDMERELKRSIELDPKFDFAGAARTLGVLYMEAPGAPMSVGSKTKARALLERALELAPNYPDSHLTMIEALMKWKDKEALSTKMAAYAELLPKAKKEFSGHDWEWEWTDWNKRWEAIQAKNKKK
jgi:tetratricopeptide (TPR) repeat protein